MDLKTMATKSKEVNPVIPVAREIKGGREAEMDGYHTIASSSTESMENPYLQRRSAVEAALGNKDSVKV